LNLEGLSLPDLSTAPWPAFLARVACRNFHVEIHRKAVDLPGLLAPLLASGARVCIDHFGRPDPEQGADDPGFRALLDSAATGRVWVKVSAAYRTGGVARGEVLAPALLACLVAAFGPQRLIWASDWPHTQHESEVTHRDCFEALARWAAGESLARRIRTEGVASLLEGTSRAR
jgi:predicted TIM-barrel fold metal-dependent hydrolase